MPNKYNIFVLNDRDATNGVKLLDPARHLKLSDPRALQRNKNMRHVYVDGTTGMSVAVQLGGPQAPLPTAMFNGRDFDSDQPDKTKRSLSVSIGEQESKLFDKLLADTVARLIQDPARYFPDQPDITAADVDAITQGLYQDSEYGPQMRINLSLNDGTELVVPSESKPGKYLPATDLPWSDDDKKPVRAGTVMLLKWHVYIADARRRKKSGPVYEKIAFKLTPLRVCLYEAPDGSAGGGPGSVPSSIPLTALPSDPGEILLGKPKPWRDLFYVDILTAGGKSLRTSIGSSSEMVEVAMLPKYSEEQGEVTTVDFSPSPDEVAAITRFETEVLLPAIRANKQQLFGADVADEVIDESFTGMLRVVGIKSDVVRATNVARCQKLVCTDGGEPAPAGPEDFTVTSKVLRTAGAALGCEIGLQIKMSGTQLDDLAVKLKPAAICVSGGGGGDSENLFVGMPEPAEQQ